MIGQAVISLLDLDEEYMITFPNGYGRSILTVPWMELGGKINVTCAKTGYYSNIEFHTKVKPHSVPWDSATSRQERFLPFLSGKEENVEVMMCQLNM